MRDRADWLSRQAPCLCLCYCDLLPLSMPAVSLQQAPPATPTAPAGCAALCASSVLHLHGLVAGVEAHVVDLRLLGVRHCTHMETHHHAQEQQGMQEQGVSWSEAGAAPRSRGVEGSSFTIHGLQGPARGAACRHTWTRRNRQRLPASQPVCLSPQPLPHPSHANQTPCLQQSRWWALLGAACTHVVRQAASPVPPTAAPPGRQAGCGGVTALGTRLPGPPWRCRTTAPGLDGCLWCWGTPSRPDHRPERPLT